MTFYRRNLPHWQPDGRAVFITWRLFGSLPRSVREAIHASPAAISQRTGKSAGATIDWQRDWGRRFRAWDSHLDGAVSGPRWLSDPPVAEATEQTIITGSRLAHYELYAYVVMSNHVHILLSPHIPLPKITKGLKGTSARMCNLILRRAGLPFWQDESFDHWVRSEV